MANKSKAALFYNDKAQALEQRIGYTFKDKGLLMEALTHSSFSNEKRGRAAGLKSNERLEFLGDSVLSVVVSRYIFAGLSDLPEGELTKLRAIAVCEDALYPYSKKLRLGECLLLGRGEEVTKGRERKSILADAFEALVAAVFLDGGMEEAENLILPFTIVKIKETLTSGVTKDYKSLLQQIVQSNKGDRVEYEVVSESGPDHDKTFNVEVYFNGNVVGKGTGRTKREGEQLAAREALRLFGEKV